MESLYLLIPLSILLVFVIGLIFWWSVRNGQFDDLEGPGYRVVSDDDTPRPAPGPGHREGVSPDMKPPAT
ncbi:cbb3-type cytochrome oxidase assembly protein CcoS [Zoogloea sp.]|uniref:cbb3-type cytochrome oxidase assembly protein CcoS n=1 Tax=Zoogloea sp. TaxID=49181 RepID=UPI0026138408|nr:cbb3-type cytochrome oxidase assembly protein CcoS [Zoogloea sp.]MDD3353776.1 cbb3-type cytochrome oxidase assembly protein CcoS [Zoogloea sp.]